MVRPSFSAPSTPAFVILHQPSVSEIAQRRGIKLETMMLRSLNPLLLVFGASPFRRWSPRSSLSLPKIAPLFDLRSASSSQAMLFAFPYRPQYGGHVKSLHVFSGGPGSSPAGDTAASPAIASPVTSSAHRPKDKFCQHCGGLTKQVIPDGDEKMRAVCTLCGGIHYDNPKMVVGCLVEHDGKVLLCKRNIHPSYGLWTLPAGYLEIGESAAEGATRETFEEANAEVEVISPFVQLDIPLIGQVRKCFPHIYSMFLFLIFSLFMCPLMYAVQSYIIFRAKMKNPHFSPGPESLECMLCTLDDIPFESLAFSSMHVTLKMYAEDIKNGKLRFHYGTINKRPGASPSDPNGFDVEYHIHS